MTDLVQLIQTSDLRESQNVSNLLEGGASLTFEEGLKAERTALLETYQARVEHLAQLNSHHAVRLKRATEEFCQNLEQLEEGVSVGYAQVDDTLLGSYIVWHVVDTQNPIGCLYVIGKSELPEEDWETLWNNP